MTRVPVTDEVVSQLRTVLDSGRLDDPHNWSAAQFTAQDLGCEALATFIYEADAATYYEAVEQAQRGEE
jgi:hypothetical protein